QPPRTASSTLFPYTPLFRSIGARQRERTVRRRAPQHHALERRHRRVLQIPREPLHASRHRRRRWPAAPAPAAFFFVRRRLVSLRCLRRLYPSPTRLARLTWLIRLPRPGRLTCPAHAASLCRRGAVERAHHAA